MKPLYLIELITLAALWGASFLFMRMGAPEFGPIVLIALRTGIAAVFLLPLVIFAKKFHFIIENIIPLFLAGIIGTAIPFCLLSFATLFVSAGYASIINATAPIFTAIIAWLWIKEKLTAGAIAGLIIGFCGVIILVFDDQGDSTTVTLIPLLAGLGATFCYGLGANFTRQKLGHIHPLAIAGGSQLGAAISLFPLSIWLWPQQMPDTQAWVSVTVLGIACTGIAFILFFRLIANVGVNKAISVTYLIPFFGVVWGIIFLNESLSLLMFLGGLLILTGVSLSTGLININRYLNRNLISKF